MSKICWVLVNCNSLKEAERLGRLCLQARLAACFDVFKRTQTVYFWPPRTGRLASGRGALLILETRPSFFKKVSLFIKSHHSDQLPFIGRLNVEVDKAFAVWLKAEVK